MTLQKTYGFTLIEVMIAVIILGWVVFAVLRMLTNNTQQTALLDEDAARRQIEWNIKQCILSLGYNQLAEFWSSTGGVSFWDGGACLTGTTATGILLKKQLGNEEVNPIEITNYFIIQTGSTSHTITLKTETTHTNDSTTFSVRK